ncbi:MAG: MFS transporter [Chloroflexota bacterium]
MFRPARFKFLQGSPLHSVPAASERRHAPALHPAVLATVLVAGHAIKHMYNSGFFLLLPEIQAHFQLSNAGIGGLSTARSIAGSLSNLPAGFVADRHSRHWALILGMSMIVIGIFQFVMGSINVYAGVVVSAVIVSAAISFWHPPAIAALSQRFADRKGFALSLHGSGGSVGEALGPVIVGALLATMAWSLVLQVSMIPALATGIIVWALMRTTEGRTGPASSFGAYLRSLTEFIKPGPLMMIFLATGGFSMAQAAVNTFLPIYLRNELNYAPYEAAGYLFLGQVAGIASSPLLGHASDRFGRRVTLVPCLGMLGASIFAVSQVPPGIFLVLAVICMGAFMFPLMALFLANAMDIVGEHVQATTVALVYGIGTLFGSTSPLIAGALADSYGVTAAFHWGAAVAALSAILFMASMRKTRKQPK